MKYTWACEMHCSPFNYTRGVQCLECRVANGDPAMDREHAQTELGEWNVACGGVSPRTDQDGNSEWAATSSITAVPTTTYVQYHHTRFIVPALMSLPTPIRHHL